LRNMSFFDGLERFASEVEKFFRGKPEALKLKSCKKCSFYKRGYCTQTSPPTRVLSEYYAQGCIYYTTSLPVVGVNIKNTWQDAENLDATHGYTSYIWIPDETLNIKLLKLHIYAEKFRAYSKGASSGGGTTETTTENTKIYGNKILVETIIGHDSGYLIETFMDACYLAQGAHDHSVTIPNHTHPIEYSIYEEAITGRTLSAKLYDPEDNLLKDFGVITTGEDDLILDLSDYFETLQHGMFRLELTASGRLRSRLIYYELCVMSAVN